jgi:hypothetical protein
MIPMSLAINVAPFANRPGAWERQLTALEALNNLIPSWCTVGLAAVLFDARNFPAHTLADPNCWLSRDAATSLKGALHLPYVQEMILCAESSHNRIHRLNQSSKDPGWYGFINNDNIVTPRFFEHFQETDKECLMVRVSDIKALPKPGGGPWGPIRRRNPFSLDGLFVRGDARDVFWDTYPDFILGDAWDPGTFRWASRHLGNRAGFINDDAVLHLIHGGSPARGTSKVAKEYVPTVVGKYNQDLAKASRLGEYNQEFAKASR